MAVSDTPHRLVLVRHGKADSFGSSDHERVLTDRGRRDAHAVGQWLADQGWRPDLALVSTATRTRQTWQAIAEGLGGAHQERFDDGVYSADVDSLLDLLRETDAGTGTLLVCGHNPTIASLVHTVDDGEGDPAALTAVLRDFPPATAALCEVHGDWADLGPGRATLRAARLP